MAFVAPFFTGLATAATSGAAAGASLGAAGSLIGTGTAAGVGAGLGMGAGTLFTGTGLGLLGTGLGVMGAMQTGQAGQQAAAFNMQTAQMEGAAKEAAQRRQASRQLGSIRAGIAKSGARMEGTPLMVLAESAANAELDALNTRFSTGRQMELERMRGTQARRAAYWSAGTSLLTGASRIF